MTSAGFEPVLTSVAAAFGKSVFLATYLQALDELAPPSLIIAGTSF